VRNSRHALLPESRLRLRPSSLPAMTTPSSLAADLLSEIGAANPPTKQDLSDALTNLRPLIQQSLDGNIAGAWMSYLFEVRLDARALSEHWLTFVSDFVPSSRRSSSSRSPCTYRAQALRVLRSHEHHSRDYVSTIEQHHRCQLRHNHQHLCCSPWLVQRLASRHQVSRPPVAGQG
jgi:hypothetical protein